MVIILTYFKNNSENDNLTENNNPLGDWIFSQRAYPNGKIDQKAYIKAIKQKRDLQNQTKDLNNGMNNSWEFCGPTNVGGRVTDVEMPSGDQQTIYVGAASGGIFKSEDQGSSWTSIFDDALSLSIGDIAIAPSDENIIYVGTGEANAGGGSLAYDGVGVYKSLDAGQTWEHKGLDEVGSIGKVVINPNNPNVLYVAAMGHLFDKNEERGIYKSSDGGDNWEQVFYLSDSTGGIDLLIHPQDPNIIYAAMWERIRTPEYRTYGGPTTGIYKSIDAGENWVELTSGLPSQASQKGRIGMSLSHSDPNILYATYAKRDGSLQGIYKSENNGDMWTSKSTSGLDDLSYMWWYSKIVIDPSNPNIVYFPGFRMHKSTNGANSWNEIFYGAHVDQHSLFVHPQNTNFILAGNDGGLYKSMNGGSSMQKLNNLPITQFYTCEIDNTLPQRLYGGAQDNGSLRTMTGSVDDWTSIYGGDGFCNLVDPTDNSYVYVEYQYGNMAKSSNGGTSFYYCMDGIGYNDRMNWNTPIVFDPNNPNILYYGSNKLYKSVNKATSWIAISGDLSNGAGSGNLTYGTITTISASPLNADVIYAGTDDGNVWLTQNGGSTWTNISTSLPDRWVTRLAVDPFDSQTAYVCFSGYRWGSDASHVYKTSDFGNTWTDIASNLPDVPVNDILINPIDSSLYLATDVGVFCSTVGSNDWAVLCNELPNVPVLDIDYHVNTKTLVAATFGRSMYKYEVFLVGAENTLSPNDNLTLFPNPVRENGILTFKNDLSQHYTIDIFSTGGRKLKNITNAVLPVGVQNISFSTSGIADGIYFIVIRNENNRRLVRKFIIKN